MYEDLLCIICYKQIANTKIKPCLHKGCKECIMTYMTDNHKCFMCRQPIESIQSIAMDELEKEKEKIRNHNEIQDDYEDDKKGKSNKDKKDE